jgi:hypothetical protein
MEKRRSVLLVEQLLVVGQSLNRLYNSLLILLFIIILIFILHLHRFPRLQPQKAG